MTSIVLPHVKTASDLVTSHRAVCEGFLEQALAKTNAATPYIDQAHHLWKVLKQIPDLSAAAHCGNIQDELLSAAGLSDKALSHLSLTKKESALKRVFFTVGKKANGDWREELVYRFLLTKGDSLGGSMRNITGSSAGMLVSEAIIKALTGMGSLPRITRSSRNSTKIQIIEWDNRMLMFDKKPKFVNKNIDMILLDTSGDKVTPKQLLETENTYIACGELKGGIDPAGADEHWKTANSALDRIRRAFNERTPAIFFIGAAIAETMAKEIFEQIQNGHLTFAANLTVPEQVSDFVSWLVDL